MNQAPCLVIAVDIGNSAAKWSGRLTDSPPSAGGWHPSPLHRLPLAAPNWVDQLLAQVRETYGQASLNHARWQIASVRAPAAALLTQRLEADLATASDALSPAAANRVQLVTRHQVPMLPRVRHPDALGIDRLLAGWMATGLSPGQRLVVIDAGSAITVDSVVSVGLPTTPAQPDNREFLGGAILPGLALQLESLSRGTAALPSLLPYQSPDDAEPRPALVIPATDTEAAIRNGVLCGAAGAIDRLIELSLGDNMMNICPPPESPIVFLTGGDARVLSPWLRQPHVVQERLVVDALLNLPASNSP